MTPLTELRENKLKVAEGLVRHQGNVYQVAKELHAYERTIWRLIDEDLNLKSTQQRAKAGEFKVRTLEDLRLDRGSVMHALLHQRGHLKNTALALNTSRDNLNKILEEDEDLKKTSVNIREGRIDDVEDVAFEKALKGDNSMVRMILLATPEGKRRGWIERPADDPIRHKTEIVIKLDTPWSIEKDQGEVVEAEVVPEIEAPEVEGDNTPLGHITLPQSEGGE